MVFLAFYKPSKYLDFYKLALFPHLLCLFHSFSSLLILVLSLFLSVSIEKRNMYHMHQHLLPCLHCHPHSYIRMVQHLIERCLLLHMSRDQCIKALAEHASIRPLVTLTVWRELQKENRDFFQAYFHSISPRPFPSRCIQRVPRFARKKH